MSRVIYIIYLSIIPFILKAQNAGVGLKLPLPNSVEIEGNLSVGAGYTGNIIPANGAIVEGSVGIGTSNPLTRLHVSGADNDGSTATLRITSGSQNMLLDGNEIDVANNGDLFLQNNSTGNTYLTSGGGKVGIGSSSFASDASLFVNGNVRVTDDADILGIDKIVGYNDLRFFGDSMGGPDLRIGGPGYAGFGGGLFSNVALNVRNIPNNTGGQIMNVELADGTNIFQIQADQDIFVIGDFFVNNGTKNFILDHPLYPENYSLAHTAIEGPGHITQYHGTVIMDKDSTATVRLPDYFEALNTDYHYQLTCVGDYAEVYVSEEINDNSFRIAGGKPGLKISWQVTAERNDPWARDHPYQSEIRKEGDEKGKYWYPEGYGYSHAMQIGVENEN